MSIQSPTIPETDAQLVAAVAVHDPELAHRVQLRLRSLRLRRIAVLAHADDHSGWEGARHSVWHSLRWPWARRG